jgi:hypothetical protein
MRDLNRDIVPKAALQSALEDITEEFRTSAPQAV